jgi:hypothetical protein
MVGRDHGTNEEAMGMTRYRDPATLGDPRWPQTGLRVAEVGDRTFWIRRIPTQGRTVYWRVLEYSDEALVWSHDYPTLKRAREKVAELEAYWTTIA